MFHHHHHHHQRRRPVVDNISCDFTLTVYTCTPTNTAVIIYALHALYGDSSLVRRVICPKRIAIGLGLGSNLGVCTIPFRTNDPSDN